MEDQPKIIQGNFGPRRTTEPGPYAKPTAGNPAPGDPRQPSPPTFTPEVERPFGVVIDPTTGKEIRLTLSQQKAISLILMHKTFVMVALSPTETGCDFHRVAFGVKTDLQNAAPYLHTQLNKALADLGILL